MPNEESTEYEWIAWSECPVCTGMEGFYASPPTKPHPHCQCTIAAYVGTYGEHRCVTEWDYVQLETDFEGSESDPTIILHFLVTVWCWDGSMYQQECTIVYDPPDRDFGIAWVEAQLEDAANQIALDECPPMTEECLGVS